MSYAASAALQEAIFQRLSGDVDLAALAAGGVMDAMPAGPLPGTYVALGPETVRDRSDVSGAGSEHDLTVSVISDEAGFATAKRAAGAVTDALRPDLSLSQGHLVDLAFLKARALRADKGASRRIDLIFRARVAG